MNSIKLSIAYIIWENNESMSGLISIQFVRHAILGALNYNLIIFYKNQIVESKKKYKNS